MGPYEEYVLTHMPKVLSQMDRDIHSKTYGSFDRGYWHLKLHDFSSAILQQSALTLSLAYTIDFEGNIYFNNSNIKEWACAALRYMTQIQLPDGSFNEYYPNEHGFPPTAFNLFAGCYTYILLGLDDEQVLQTLRKSAYWLCRHEETSAYNQEIAALSGLALFCGISDDETIRQAIKDKVGILSDAYCDEGWFPEQGGADIGYLSVSLDLLGEYYRATKDSWAKEKITKVIDFLSCFVHPDGTTGGEYASRNTTYFMPAGFEIAVETGLDTEGTAERIVQKVFGDKPRGQDHMLAVDERYNTHYVMHSFLRALRYRVNSERGNTDQEQPFKGTRYFEKAGLAVISDSRRYIVFSASKGGVLKVFLEGRELLCDCGYRIPIKPGITAATNWVTDSNTYTFEDEKFEVSGAFHKVRQKVQNPVFMMGLRVAGLILGKKLNSLIKRLTINQKQSFDAIFKRVVRLTDEVITIEDWIDNPKEYELTEAPNVSLRLVASGKFFSRSDLISHELHSYGRVNKFHRVRTVDLRDGRILTGTDHGTE